MTITASAAISWPSSSTTDQRGPDRAERRANDVPTTTADVESLCEVLGEGVHAAGDHVTGVTVADPEPLGTTPAPGPSAISGSMKLWNWDAANSEELRSVIQVRSVDPPGGQSAAGGAALVEQGDGVAVDAQPVGPPQPRQARSDDHDSHRRSFAAACRSVVAVGPSSSKLARPSATVERHDH